MFSLRLYIKTNINNTNNNNNNINNINININKGPRLNVATYTRLFYNTIYCARRIKSHDLGDTYSRVCLSDWFHRAAIIAITTTMRFRNQITAALQCTYNIYAYLILLALVPIGLRIR